MSSVREILPINKFVSCHDLKELVRPELTGLVSSSVGCNVMHCRYRREMDPKNINLSTAPCFHNRKVTRCDGIFALKKRGIFVAYCNFLMGSNVCAI